jgi:hypothetical protein
MTRTGAAPQSQKQEIPNEPNFPLNPMKGNPLAIQPSNPRDRGFPRTTISGTFLIGGYRRSSAARILFLLPKRKEPAMTRTAPLLKAENKKYRNEPYFPSNPKKGNPLAVQPSNPRVRAGFGEPPLQARFSSPFLCVHRRLKSFSYCRRERSPHDSHREAPQSQKQEIPNEPNFPSNPMKGNLLAIQPSNPCATTGSREPQPPGHFLSAVTAFIGGYNPLPIAKRKEPAMTRTAPLLEAENKKYRNEPNFPSNPMKGNPLAVQPSNPRAIGGLASPQLSKVPLQSQKPNAPNEPNFRPNPMKSKLACGPSPRRSSSAKRSSGHYLPPANGPTRRPKRSILRPLIAITDISGLACAISARLWGSPPSRGSISRVAAQKMRFFRRQSDVSSIKEEEFK